MAATRWRATYHQGHTLLLNLTSLWQGCEVLCWVCLSVSLSAGIIEKPHGWTSSTFLYMLSVVLAWSFSDGIVIRHLLQVLWMTLYFLHNCPTARRVYSYVAIEHDKDNGRNSSKILFNDDDWKYSLSVMHHGWSLLSTIVLQGGK